MAGRLISVSIHDPSMEAVSAASSVLREGGVVVYPSDTVYGILADSGDTGACSLVSRLKGYSEPRPFIHLAGTVQAALRLTCDDSLRRCMEEHWPGPVTLLVPSPEGKIGLRVPADPLSLAIISATGLSLISTSANRKGGSNPLCIGDIPESILQGADVVLDGGTLPSRRPSMIIDLTGPEPVRLR